MAFDYVTIGGLPPSASPPSDDALLLTPADVASRLRCSLSYAYRLIERGTLPSVRLGRVRRVPAASLDSFVDALLSDEAQGRTARDRIALEASGEKWKRSGVDDLPDEATRA